jgi:putative ubiquitin-RnfH superfamily antitoxin RatB of RatAB toxin-antitoxin module
MIEGIKIQHIKVFQGKEGPERLQTERPVEQAERLETDRPLITDPRSSQV